ncbi:MAG: hypothetical protein ACJ8AI_19575 [Rhodopila sp.]
MSAISSSASLTQLLHFDGFDSRKAAEFCGSSRWQSNCGAKNRYPSDGVFHLDRLGHSMLAFRAEQGISLHWTPRIKVLPRSSRSDLFKLSLPATQGVVPKKKALIQVYFPAQTAEVGLEDAILRGRPNAQQWPRCKFRQTKSGVFANSLIHSAAIGVKTILCRCHGAAIGAHRCQTGHGAGHAA